MKNQSHKVIFIFLVSTFRYANRAKNIKNKPKINEDPKDALLREFQEEIARLKSQLGGNVGGKKKGKKKKRSRRGPDGESPPTHHRVTTRIYTVRDVIVG